MSENMFHFENGKENFENHANENGYTYWTALTLMEMLGYTSWATFNQVISKAMTTCNTLSISIVGNFDQIHTIVDDKPILDFKLSRFACYLIAMNGSVAMPQVAKAQAYFATIAGAVQDYQIEAGKVERLQIRSEITDREKSLSGAAFTRGLENYPYFQNAGYRGMYNKNIGQLKAIRRIETNKSLLDYMGKEELAANLFRITQTEMKIKTENVIGQNNLERAAESVGKKVRATMIEISNTAPEYLPKHEDIKDVKRGLKNTSKEFKKLGEPKKKSPKKK